MDENFYDSVFSWKDLVWSLSLAPHVTRAAVEAALSLVFDPTLAWTLASFVPLIDFLNSGWNVDFNVYYGTFYSCPPDISEIPICHTKACEGIGPTIIKTYTNEQHDIVN